MPKVLILIAFAILNLYQKNWKKKKGPAVEDLEKIDKEIEGYLDEESGSFGYEDKIKISDRNFNLEKDNYKKEVIAYKRELGRQENYIKSLENERDELKEKLKTQKLGKKKLDEDLILSLVFSDIINKPKFKKN